MTGQSVTTPRLSVGVNWFAYATGVTAANLRDVVLRSAESAAAAGFSAVELPVPLAEHLMDDLGRDGWARLAGDVRGLGLEVHSVHGPNLPPLDRDLSDVSAWLRRYAECCVAMNVQVMVVHPTSHTHPHVCTVMPKLLQRDIDLARVVSDAFADSSVKLAIENLPTYSLRYLAELMDRLGDRDNVGVCFDTGHWNVRPEFSLSAAVAMLGPRIVHLHLSDNRGLCDEHRPPGQGNFDWRGFAGALPGRLWSQPWMVELSTPILQDHPDAAEQDRRLLVAGYRDTRKALQGIDGPGPNPVL